MKFIGYLLVLLIFIDIGLFFITNKIIFELTFLVILFMIIFAIIKLKCIIYETSGGCVSIKKHHPFTFKKIIIPEIEFPQDQIINFSLIQKIGFTNLIFHVLSKREKRFKTKTRLFGFSISK